MLKKTITFIIILLIVIVILTIGENIGAALLEWISNILGITIRNINDLIRVVTAYVLKNPIKSAIGVIISLFITIVNYSKTNKEDKE